MVHLLQNVNLVYESLIVGSLFLNGLFVNELDSTEHVGIPVETDISGPETTYAFAIPVPLPNMAPILYETLKLPLASRMNCDELMLISFEFCTFTLDVIPHPI